MATLTETTEQQKAKILEIGASTGDAGVKAYQEAEAQVRAAQQAALGRVRAAGQAAGADPGAMAELARIAGEPGDRYAANLASSRASFQNIQQTNQQANLGYLTSLGALQPLIDARIEQARIEAASKGSGGSGGGGGDLSDSELRVRLTGMAEAVRGENVAKASEALGGARTTKGKARAAVLGTRKKIRKIKRGGVSDREKARLAALKKLREQQIKALKKERLGARKAYAGAVDAIRQPLGEVATQVGMEAGVDEATARGLFGPTQQKSLNAADAAALKEEGGVQGLLGHAPRLSRGQVARQLKGTTKRSTAKDREIIKTARRSKQYRIGAQFIEDELRNGSSAADVMREIQASKKMKRIVAEVLLSDYAPAFGS